MKLTTKILLGLILGSVVGVAVQASGSEGAKAAVLAFEPLGTAFIRLISMVVVPLVVASLFVGTCSVGDIRRLGRIGGRSVAYFLATTLIASAIGLYLGVLVKPGSSLDPEVRDQIAEEYQATAEASAAVVETVSLRDRLLEIIPRNPVGAAADMDLLPLIVATLLFAAAASVLEPEKRDPLVAFFDGVNGAAGVIIDWVMKLAPYAVFILIAGAMARFGVGLLRGLLLYSVLIIVGEAINTPVLVQIRERYTKHGGESRNAPQEWLAKLSPGEVRKKKMEEAPRATDSGQRKLFR